MNTTLSIIRKKQLLFVLIPVAYLVVTGLIKWRLQPPVESLLYLGGGLVGVYFLDVAEAFFKVSPSPFRSIVFVGLFSVVSLFVVTSSGSLVASGLVLSLFLTLLLWQVGQFQALGQLDSWYAHISGRVAPEVQKLVLAACIFVFFVETFLFVF